ncbi:MAG: hypothetical protein MJ231_07710 [bacterium]|nr:hypothetical protein [bacterium]
MTDGISAITSSPLGAYGLGMNGAYSSYPSMMSMYGMGGYGTNSYNPMFGGMGMMGMYNPDYMMQLANVQNEMEMNQIRHAQSINQLITDGQVNASAHADKAFVKQVFENGSVKNLMSGLIDGIRNKDLENICNYFDAVKKQIISTYGDEISARGYKENVNLAAIELIEALYTTEVNAQSGRQNANLRDDIAAIGENAFVNGFKCEMRPGHSTRDLKSVMNHCFGTEITEREHDKTSRAIGGIAGRVAHGGKFAAQSTGVIAGGTILGLGAGKLITAIVPAGYKKDAAGQFILNKDGKKIMSTLSEKIKFWPWLGKGFKLAAGVGAALGLVEIFAPGTITGALGLKKQQATA